MKPFYVRHKNREEAIEVIDRAVANGAVLLEAVDGHHNSGCTYSPTDWELIGVDDDSRTMFYDSPTNYGWEVKDLTIEQVREMYPLPEERNGSKNVEGVSGETEGWKFSIGDDVEYESPEDANTYTGKVIGYDYPYTVIRTNLAEPSSLYCCFMDEDLVKVEPDTLLLHEILDILYYGAWTIPEQAEEILKLFNKGEDK